MTLVLIWYEASNQSVWAVSDSRISSTSDQGDRRVSTDQGGKILAAPITLLMQGVSNARGYPVRSTSIGFAYAGNVFVNMQAFEAIVPLWSQLLIVRDSADIPEIAALADHYAIFFKKYAADLFELIGEAVHSQSALFGWCERSQAYKGFVLETTFSGGSVDVAVREMDLTTPFKPEMLGYVSDELLQDYSEFSNRCKTEMKESRAPRRFLDEVISSGKYDTIGGAQQLGIAQRGGFQVYYIVRPIEVGKPQAVMEYRGFDVTEISRIGPNFVGLPGMT